jgi:hypothetical protein
VHGTPPAIDQSGIGSPCLLSAVRVVAPVALRPFVRSSRRLCSQHGVGVLQRQRLSGAQRFAFGLGVELIDLLGHEREAID